MDRLAIISLGHIGLYSKDKINERWKCPAERNGFTLLTPLSRLRAEKFLANTKSYSSAYPCLALQLKWDLFEKVMIARAATAQDDITGDGTTSVVLMVGELLKQADRYISEGLHPRIITDGYEIAKTETLKVCPLVIARKDAANIGSGAVS